MIKGTCSAGFLQQLFWPHNHLPEMLFVTGKTPEEIRKTFNIVVGVKHVQVLLVFLCLSK